MSHVIQLKGPDLDSAVKTSGSLALTGAQPETAWGKVAPTSVVGASRLGMLKYLEGGRVMELSSAPEGAEPKLLPELYDLGSLTDTREAFVKDGGQVEKVSSGGPEDWCYPSQDGILRVFLDQGDRAVAVFYMDSRARLHNEHGPAVVMESKGGVIRGYFLRDKAISENDLATFREARATGIPGEWAIELVPDPEE